MNYVARMFQAASGKGLNVTRAGFAARWKEQVVEAAVFLFLIVPSMVLSLFAAHQGSLGFTLLATATIFRDLALVSLVCFFLWRNGEPFSRLGWEWRHVGREMLLGCALYVPLFLGAAMLESLLLKVGLHAPETSLLRDRGLADAVLGVVLVAVVTVAEETIFRGYLLLRFQTILGNTTAALLLSSVIFAIGHGYEGSAGVVTVGMMGLVFGVVYLWRGSLVAPMTMHFIQDFAGIVLIPLLGWK